MTWDVDGKMGKLPRYNIAFFSDVLSGYEAPIWSGAASAARQYDVNFFTFVSGPISNWYLHATEKLVSPEYLDGIIAISGTLGGQASDDELESFYRTFAPLPIVSISRIIRGTYSMMSDNQSGIHQLMKHLIEEHNHRHIAFITGKAQNSESILRLQAYQESLRQYGLPYDENLVYYGDFFWEGGNLAIRAFIDERKVQFDAVVAANDYMAISAIQELRRRGYRVPEDIAVVGFDDMDEAKTMDLTTVRQPLDQFGYESVKMLISLIGGETPETPILYLPTDIVLRGSCGCSRTQCLGQSLTVSEGKNRGCAGRSQAALSELLNKGFPAITERMGVNWSEEISQALNRGMEDAFLAALEKGIKATFDKGMEVFVWYNILRLIEQSLDPSQWDRGRHAMINNGFEMVGRLAYALRESEQKELDSLYSNMQRFYQVFNNAFNDYDEILRWLKEFLLQVRIGGCFIARYEEADWGRAKLFVYLNAAGSVQLDSPAGVFATRSLVPGRFRRDGERYSYFVRPIMQLGYALFEVSALEKTAYYAFINQISNAINLTALTVEILQYTSKLEQKVAKRTRELNEAQANLLKAAHQAGMAEIAISVLHNIGNVLTSASISIEEIRKRIRKPTCDGLKKVSKMLGDHQADLGDFLTHDAKGSLLPKYIAMVSEEIDLNKEAINSEVEHVMEKMKLMNETIIMLQDYARSDTNMVLKERVDLAALIEAALRIQESYLHKFNVRVEKFIENLPAYSIEKNKLIHVLVNIIKNAVEAMENTEREARILTIRLFQAENDVVIQIADRGEGIAQEQLTKIFRHGYTTKADGHGFGLHACANYIREMGGTLTAQSDGVGKGATFSLRLPAKV